MPCRPGSLLASTALAAAVLAVSAAGAAAEAPKVVASIKPVHSLVAGVMAGVGEPGLLIPPGASPHSYQMRPSEARMLNEADVVFYVGEDLETFLERPLQALGGDARVVALMEAADIELLPIREDEAFEAHVHDDDEHAHDDHGHDDDHEHEAAHHGEHGHDREAAHHDEHEHEHAEAAHADDHGHDRGHEAAHHDDHDHHHHHGDIDAHVWLDPHNARAIVEVIAAELSEVDPGNEAAYRENARDMSARLEALDEELRATLEPVRDVPFIVFHDAYQYLENRYGLNVVGSITVSPERAPGAHRLREVRAKIRDLGARCVFSEPQFEPRLVATVIEGTDARTGVLDPEGGVGPAGPDAYFELMRANADALVGCLAGQS